MDQTTSHGVDRAVRRHLLRRTAGLLLSVSALLVIASCASGGREADNPFRRGSVKNEIEIRVVNLNFSDATLWAHVRSARQRLGIVGGKRDAVFHVPWEFVDPLRIEIDLLAGDRCVTSSLTVAPGDVVELQIAANLRMTQGCG
ncbi:MAG: hypothetical protein OEZ65_11725 [Gemmatimonadota bacterium]|nr:hypothetical protein [Gemmatimonadota bacterium]MDH5760250.1 hypothetical protein [Gemmatimonadota bacterium]